MIILLSIFIFTLSSYACEFTESVRSVYSLSGPITLALKDLKLINSSKLRGVSAFHPIDKSFLGEILPGGVFLSMDRINQMKGAIVFYDEARELSKSFRGANQINAIQVKTRNLNPIEVSHQVEKVLGPFVRDCKFSQLHKDLENKMELLGKLIPNSTPYLFFLGEIRGGRFPEVMMVQDGVVKWMVQEHKLQTYPSALAYVAWSSKLMSLMPNHSLKVGLVDSGNKMIQSKQHSLDTINLTFPGCLIPGAGQVDCMLYLFKK